MAKKRPEKKKGKRKSGAKNPRNEIMRRAMFYAVSLFVVFQLLLLPLESLLYSVYWGVAVLGLIVVLVELIYARTTEKRKPIEVDMKHLRDRKWREHLLHHLFFPVVLYGSGVLYLFFNRIRALDQVAVILLCGTFFVIFYNMAATYRKMYRVTRNTRMLFDFVNIIVFYFFTDVLINLVVYEGWPRIVVFIGGGVITFALIGLTVALVRQVTLKVFLAMTASSLVIGMLVLLIWMVPIFNIAVLSLVATIGFYMVDVYWHHRLEGTLSDDVMMQYALFAVMALILLLYL